MAKTTSFKKKEHALNAPMSSDSKSDEASLANRLLYLALAGLLISYGVTGLVRNKMEISTAKGGGGVLVFTDVPVWLLASALFVGAAVLLSVVIDHYDRRKNESWYRLFKRSATFLGLALVVTAFISYLYLGLAG